jgi:DNA-binding NarL/FixJ family response regulator
MNADLARIRLVVADDNRRVFEQLVTTLGADFDVVAYAGTGGEAVDAAIRHSPDVVVLDISMPMMSGLRAARVLREKGRPFPIVFLTVHEDEEYVRAAMEVGGLGYVLKSHLASDLVPAIRAALAGRTFVSRPYSN